VIILNGGHNIELAPTPMLFESDGRGVVLQSLSIRYGQEVMVLRSNMAPSNTEKILREAIKLASEKQAYYDYLVVAWHIIPRIIFEKLGLDPPLKYQRNEQHICSEAILEVHLRAGIPVLPDDVVPLPGDFYWTTFYAYCWQGKLTDEIV